MESKTGEMRYGTVWRYAGEKIWRVETLDGVSLRCEGLASAKVSALDLAIARLERDGYVQCIPEAEKVDEGEVIRCFVRVIEPPRLLRRLFSLRGLSYEEVEQVLARSP